DHLDEFLEDLNTDWLSSHENENLPTNYHQTIDNYCSRCIPGISSSSLTHYMWTKRSQTHV
ncbi:3549_t:CDS:1, partial [Acaulospora morrowiae]